MGRSRKKKPLYEQVTITDIGAEGKALARVNDMVVFTTHAIPGDVVDLQVTKKRKKYQEARIVKIHEKSADRVEAFCEYFGICGGCKWQFLPYEKQLFYKQQQVEDQLKRLGKVELPELSPILGSAKNTFYRNKLEFSFSNKRWLTLDEMDEEHEPATMNALGFHIPRMFDKIIDVEKCWLQPDPSNAIRNFVRSYALEHELEFFDIRSQEGFLRNMIVRTASTGENMLILAFYKEDVEKREALLNAIVEEFPELTSLMYVINSKGNDTITDQDVIAFNGPDHIFEEMEGLRFKIGPKSFYQTNSEQAYELYKVARDFANLSGNEVVYDLYTGTGTIANFVARQAQKVVGIEYIPEAIEDARINSSINGIENTSFYAGDMKAVLNDDFIADNGTPDVIITDPPRAGMHEDVVKTILQIAPEKVVYVSCNPASQARDLALMDEQYKVAKIQPVDMFPHTHHVENVVLLEKR
ncbi:23S rRNA (uracil(1939)-C(5))-methyltransferase RlmD [Sunxiuqinia elliptica]|uniref:23S rRNA (Uracil1939-C5)-methyltransferase n=1 Tax=Sunxiuqinia elliptica TaxID=655355 RepID=A0A4R6GR09_9BACT|nr:23S rRNA (uracil(1939)-C(5))-methyltransferase RlmD [Sunxiuqinia elliptica]TDN97140.1 23S rRNA (uracil1939-C5)-methyltransferase [Sunxiuqinia elliptica]TDO60675.1 23S rRNA (uracil1939-C5)-methyltransferase [Sunxiuqinia elliptica]